MTLPIDSVLPGIRGALARAPNLVLQAAPGAGKTTRVPLALLDAEWLGGRKIVVLEPRRLAARAAARFMASGLGEAVGETVGYRVRLDSKVGPRTRIELVTDGLFLRRLQADPGLDGVGAVLFDEIHERSLDVDLALALCLEAQGALRPDLRLVAMSATLEGEALARLMKAETIASQGRAFPVETRWLGRPEPRMFVEDAVAAAVRRALGESDGDVLVFLPGAGEIRRTAERLQERALPAGTRVAPLHGDLDLAAQDAAIRPSPPGERKIVLATAIAETSLTIEGVRVVIDSGLARVPRFEPASGMTRLETVRVSQAAAEQRKGRAGRVAPGLCYRLWSEAEHRSLPQYPVPEIRDADLAPLALELAVWGARDAASLAWLDPPPPQALAQARALLERLGALEGGAAAAGAVTAHGRAMAAFGAHPRLAHMMIAGKAMGAGALACDLAALVEERDPGRDLKSIDIRLRLGLLRGRGADRLGGRIRRVAEMWRRQLQAGAGGANDQAAGRLLALAYPDRVAQRRGEPGTAARGSFRLANGRGAWCDEADPLAAAPYLAVADLDGDKQDARIFRAAPLERADLEALFADRIRTEERVEWDAREAAVKARRRTTLDALVLSEAPLASPDPAAVAAAALDGVRALGLAALPWAGEPETLRARIALLRRIEGAEAGWPDVSDAALLGALDEWLAPFLGGIARRADFGRIPLARALEAMLGWKLKQRLDREAPTDIAVPSGRHARIDYVSGSEPILAVRIQEMFGATATPAICGGRVPLLLHLLSPAQRPIQVTRDLVSFWRRGYPDARGDLRGRYPKHHWPDDPFTAQPTSRVRPR
ncbi:MAG: ATP-dependent helicase HrpB [Candidatus Odyssella sp.]|nr:ATP-dependent helicase HrpB [Candidatus Odyssella sp.]